MSEQEYLEFIRRFPYDAMGNYSIFRDEKKENSPKTRKENSQNQ